MIDDSGCRRAKTYDIELHRNKRKPQLFIDVKALLNVGYSVVF